MNKVICCDPSPSPTISTTRKLNPGLRHPSSEMPQAWPSTHPAQKEFWKGEQRKTSPQPTSALRQAARAGVPRANIWLLCEQGTQGSYWAASALLGAVQMVSNWPRAPLPTAYVCRKKGRHRAEGAQAARFAVAAHLCPTLHVTTAPTSGRSWDSASLTTDTTGSCRAADITVS